MEIKKIYKICLYLLFCGMTVLPALPALGAKKGAADTPKAAAAAASAPEAPEVIEADIHSQSIFARAWDGGIVVFLVLVMLVAFSVGSWALILSKFIFLRRMGAYNDAFIKSFWESRSLNELNGRLADYPYSPAKEMFRTGYSELVRGSQVKDAKGASALSVQASMDNLGRSLQKARTLEKKRLEKYLPILATIASAAPFIGLFGTVWGIMGAFEGIARTGSASLAAVAPGISEALIATAFGLAAAIPAVMGYNLALSRIKTMIVHVDGFGSDFLNIVERYLVSDKTKNPGLNNQI